jgi:hypothetical protein
MNVEKLMQWAPLLLVAGYFLFLVATWQKFLSTQLRINEVLAELRSNVATDD